MSFAAAGAVDPALGIVLVIGANIGGTFPPLMMIINEGAVARRVPVGNIVFKVTGAVIALPLLGIIEPWLTAFDDTPARMIVNFHTIFNLGIAALFLFLTTPMSALLTKLFPEGEDLGNPSKPRYLDRHKEAIPALALSSAARETLRMGEIVEDMLERSLQVFQTDDHELAREIAQTDNVVDSLHEAIKIYMTRASRSRMDADESHRAAEIMSFNTNLEHIGDIIENLMDLASKKIKKRMHFSHGGIEDIIDLHRKVLANMEISLSIFMAEDIKLARHLLSEKREVVLMERMAVDRHMARLLDGKIESIESIESSALHMDILRDLKRIHSHIVTVAYPVLEAAGELESLQRHVNGEDSDCTT